jgi:hypothetical protein
VTGGWRLRTERGKVDGTEATLSSRTALVVGTDALRGSPADAAA